MSSAVAVREAPQAGMLSRFSSEQVDVLKKQITYAGIKDEELEYFLTAADRIDLDPFAIPKEIYAVKRGDKMCIQLAVDGAIKLAMTRGDLEWISPVEFYVQSDKVWRWTEIWMPGYPISHARVSIKRRNVDREFRFTIRKDAYSDGKNSKWNSEPDQMLAACVTRNALVRSGAIHASLIDPELRSIIRTEEPRYDEETGELLCSNATRQALHSGHNHAEVHAVAVEVAGVDSVAELTEEQAQEVLEVLNTPEATGQTTIVEMGKPASRDRKEEV